jgi:hypothetical protein
MPINFPITPTLNQTSVQNGRTFVWSGTAWNFVNNVIGHGGSHAADGTDAVLLSAAQITSGRLNESRLPASAVLASILLASVNSSTEVIDAIPRNIQNTATVLTSGSLLLTFFTPLVTRTITQVTVGTGNTAAAGLTLARLGLYTFDESTATLVAAVASDTTLFASANTAYTRSLSTGGGLPSSYTLTAGSRYGLALLAVGTTMPNIIGLNSSGFNLAPLPPRTNGQIPSQTNLPVTFVAGNLSVTTILPYARLS